MEINKVFLEKALTLLPTPMEQTVTVANTVTFKKDGRNITTQSVEDYRKQVLSRGDSICLDFADHQVGYLHLKLRRVGGHPDAPVPLRIKFAELPVELFENPDDYHGAICSGWIQHELLHIDTVPCVLHMPRRYAFRYVQIEVLDISPNFKLAVDDVYCTSVSSADDTALEPYNSNDKLLCCLDKIACRTLHDCMQTVFEDGPKRDRRLWMGDLRLQAQANYETYKNNDLVKACLYLFAALPMPNGQIGACLFLEPEVEVDDFYMFDYALLYIPTLLDYYNATGDIDTVKELYDTAMKQINIAEKWIGEDGVVIDSEEVGWRFLDWKAELNKQAGSQGVLLYAIKAAIELAEILGDEDSVKCLTEKHKKYLDASLNVLWDNDRQLFISGEDRQVSYASQVWMVLGGAVKEEAASELLEHIESQPDAVGMVTPYMYHNYVDALITAGNISKSLEVIKSYWGGMAKLGADTFWEIYNPENPDESPYGGTIVNSYCHAWSCAPAYFLRKYF